MNEYNKYVVFTLDERQFAIDIDIVERTIRAVEVTTLPDEHKFVLGAINVHGDIIFALNIRKLFHLPERDIGLNDQFIFINTDKRRMAILADEVSGVVERSEQEVIKDKAMLPDMEYVGSAIKLEDGTICMVLKRDIDRYLAHKDEVTLKSTMQG